MSPKFLTHCRVDGGGADCNRKSERTSLERRARTFGRDQPGLKYGSNLQRRWEARGWDCLGRGSK